MRYKVAIFDMDGTILDTLDDLHEAMNYALSSCNLPKITKEASRSFVGNGIRKFTERAVSNQNPEQNIDKVFEAFMPYYKEHSADKTKEYDGISELIKKLKSEGVKVAVVSNKADAAVKDLADKYFPSLFDVAIGEMEGVNRKPAPDEVNMAIKELGFNMEDKPLMVYIGDSDVDVKTARNSEIDLIAVDWGFRDRDFLIEQGADIIVSKPEEIFDIIVGDK